MNPSNASSVLKLSILAALLLPAITACGSDAGSDNTGASGVAGAEKAVVATVAGDYSAGAHAVFDTASPYTGATQQAPTVSDISVACHGDYFYRIEGYSGANVTRFSFTDPATPIYQYSAMASDGTELVSSNPHDLVFVSDSKAYLMRYGSNSVWVVNPRATSEADYKIGELDLGAYAVSAGLVPNIETGVVVDGYLYVLMQRLDASYSPEAASYVAVFDTLTDTEVDTGTSGEGLKGISLPVKNATSIQYLADTGLIYVNGIGAYPSFDGITPTQYTGGIATIDPETYTTSLLVDDGDANSHPYGQISKLQVVSAEVGYFAGYAGWGDETLYRFNPTTGAVEPDAVAGISGTGIGGLALDSENKLWVSLVDAAAPGIRLLDAATGSVIEERIATDLNPGNIAICSTSGE